MFSRVVFVSAVGARGAQFAKTPSQKASRARDVARARRHTRAVRDAIGLVMLALTLLAAPSLALAQRFVSRPARGLRYERSVVRRGPLRTTVHALYVDLCDPSVEVRATAPEEGGRTAGRWARLVGAAAAINGDYFATGRLAPLGPARGGGRWWPEGLREHRDALFVAAAGGRVDVLDAPDATTPALWPDAEHHVAPAWTEVVAARERIVVRGEARESPAITHDGERHPRTAVGFSEDRHTLIFIVVEGRAEDATGATVRELGAIARDLGAWEAMKLDGGGSSTMYLARGGTMNHPSDGAPRVVATHLGVIVRGDVALDAPSRCVPRAIAP
jgi:Phosphodiester glycosidase